jgi:hypothetical protein
VKIERIAAKRFHCGQIARQLRPAHADVIGKHHLNAHRNIVSHFQNSVIRQAWTIDGRLAALAGVTGSLLDRDGIAWLALGAEAERHPVPVSREALRFIDEVLKKRDLTIVVMAEDKRSSLFGVFLGFNFDERKVIDGVPTIIMSTSARKAA